MFAAHKPHNFAGNKMGMSMILWFGNLNNRNLI